MVSSFSLCHGIIWSQDILNFKCCWLLLYFWTIWLHFYQHFQMWKVRNKTWILCSLFSDTSYVKLKGQFIGGHSAWVPDWDDRGLPCHYGDEQRLCRALGHGGDQAKCRSSGVWRAGPLRLLLRHASHRGCSVARASFTGLSDAGRTHDARGPPGRTGAVPRHRQPGAGALTRAGGPGGGALSGAGAEHGGGRSAEGHRDGLQTAQHHPRYCRLPSNTPAAAVCHPQDGIYSVQTYNRQRNKIFKANKTFFMLPVICR